MADRPKRPLLPHALLALEVIAGFKEQRIPVNAYALAMSERGCFAPDCDRALATLARRQWITTDGSSIELKDAGRIAAIEAKPKSAAKKDRRSGSRRRMPPGLF